MNIAAILTVFNRRQKTLSCLEHLFAALDAYNSRRDGGEGSIRLVVYMTDDGSTDGTADSVKTQFAGRDVHIVQGTGSLFWAGGMRVAWQAAIDDSSMQWDYFLLLNDDTNVMPNVFEELFEADSYGFQKKGVHGISSGITCEPGHPGVITYGGLNFVNKTKGRQYLLQPTGTPQHIDLTHANILMVHKKVVDTIGIFHKGYTHACADNDYSMTAHRHNIPVYSTSHVCGECEHDHDTRREEAQRLIGMTLAERRKYTNSPTHSDSDYLLFVRRNLPLRYPMTVAVRAIRVYLPWLYYYINKFRGVYKH